MKVRFEIGGREHEVAPTRRAEGLRLVIDGTSHEIDLRHDGNDDRRQTVRVDGRPHRVIVAREGDRLFVHADGRAWEVRPVDALAPGGPAGGHSDHVLAPMPGTVLSVAVGEGATVAEGDAILVIESMKLETTVRAPRAAIVESLPLTTGASFDKGALLVRFAPRDAGEGDMGT